MRAGKIKWLSVQEKKAERAKRQKILEHRYRVARVYKRIADKAQKAEQQRSDRLDASQPRRLSKRESTAALANKRMDGIERHPSAAGLRLLNTMLENPELGALERTRAADLILRFADGDFRTRKRRRNRKPTDGEE